jgi:hypothetical protein
VDGVLVLDRSGSMGEPGFTGAKTKIQEAREAAALVIDLLRTVWVPESRSWVPSCEFVRQAIGPQ